MTFSRRHVAKHARRTTDALAEPAGVGNPARDDESDLGSYLDFARPPHPDDFARPPHPDDTADTADLDPGLAPSTPFADTADLFPDGAAPTPFADTSVEPNAADPAIRPFPEYEPFADDTAYEDTIVFPAPGAERPIRSHRRDEPGRRVAFRVMIASAISGSGLAIVLAAVGGGAPSVPDVPAAVPRVAATPNPPATTGAPTTSPTPSPEPAPSSSAPTSGGQAAAAQVRNAPRAPQSVGPQPDHDPVTTSAPTTPPPSTSAPTTQPTTPPTTEPTTPFTTEPTTEPTTPPATEESTTTPTSGGSPSPTGSEPSPTPTTTTITTTAEATDIVT